MSESERPPAQVTFPARAWALLVAFGVAALAFFGLAAYVFVDQLATVKDQNSKQAELILAQRPLIEEALPLVRAARADAPAARETARRTRRLLRTGVPLTEDLAAADLGDVVRDLGGASKAITSGDRLERTLQAAAGGDRLQRALSAVSAIGGEVQDRSLLERSSIVLGQIRLALRELREERFVARVPRSLDALVRRQDRLLAIQERSLAIQRRLIATQDEALARLRDIDRRLGGGVDDTPRP